MSKVELRNGSVIETLESSRPKRGQRRELITIADVIPEDVMTAIEETLGWLKLENKAGDLAIKTLEQENAKLKEELTKLLSLHCERCEDPAECNLCGWHLVTKELIK